MAQEQVNAIQTNSIQVEEMVNSIMANLQAKDSLDLLDNYINTIKSGFMTNADMSMDDLNRIIFGIPQYLYSALDALRIIEMNKGLAKEHAQYAKNEAILTATGTVAEKAARAENQTAENRITELAYTTALTKIKSKIEAANQIWDAAKKVQAAKLKDQAFTGMIGSSVPNF